MKKFTKEVILVSFMLLGPTRAFAGGSASSSPFIVLVPSAINVSSVSVSGGQAQVTITTPTSVGAFSTGYFNYITDVHIEMYAVAALTGGATPVTCTTTGIGSNPVWKFPTAAAVGTLVTTDVQYANPLQSNQASNVVITCPGTTNVIWNINVVSYPGP